MFRLLVAFYARAEWKAKAAESHPCLDPHSFLSKRRDLLGKAIISDPEDYSKDIFLPRSLVSFVPTKIGGRSEKG